MEFSSRTTIKNNTLDVNTLQMEICPEPEVSQKFKVLEGVLRVTNPQKNEFIMEYNPGLQPNHEQPRLAISATKPVFSGTM